MSISRHITVNTVINRVAAEFGITPVTDVFATDDDSFKQMTFLLTACVQELMENFDWQILHREFQFITTEDQEGVIPLPADFGYMIPQTGWERSSNVPLIGPLSPQDWTYLLGRDLVGSTIYASFRFSVDQLLIFPNSPMPSGLDINFEYVSRNLIQEAATDPVLYSDTVEKSADIILFPPHLITRMLLMKFKQAKGFANQKETDDYENALNNWRANDNSAGILNAARWRFWYPYLDVYRNLPDTGYGLP